MYTEQFQEFGLSLNEARIYEALLREGECGVGKISLKAKVHRRNVYDALERLVDKGLVFKVLLAKEQLFHAVEPNQLKELIREKEQLLTGILPGLEKIYQKKPHSRDVYIYRGIEGWKNYMRDILRVKEDFYCIGGKGAWMDPRLKDFFPFFIKEAKRKKIKFYHLFDHEVKESNHPIANYVGNEFRFLPKEFSAPASIDFFGDYVNVVSRVQLGEMEEDIWFAVIVNPQVAEAFRIWFKFMWNGCKKI
jgi:predicted transcriptional regulator